MRPRVRVDALPILGEGGISNYVRPLMEHLIGIRGSRWDVELFFRLGFRGRRRSLLEKWSRSGAAGDSAIRTSCLPDRVLCTLWQAGYGVLDMGRRTPADVVLATTEIVPRSKRSRVGWLVYDLTPLRIPQFFNGPCPALLDRSRRRARRADFIIALSECTRTDVIELLGCPEDKVAVVYPGANGPPERLAAEAAKRPVAKPYILYLGALALNKNVDGLLRVFARCVHDHHLDMNLVLTGRDFCGAGFWLDLASRLGIGDRVDSRGWVAESEKEALLSGAAMLWQFSWYEGFGLPVLEAASRSVPVLCSNRGALPEILQNPDQEIDLLDEAAAAARAAEALRSPQVLSEWKARGLRRAQEFNWGKSARRLLDCMEAAVQ